MLIFWGCLMHERVDISGIGHWAGLCVYLRGGLYDGKRADECGEQVR